MTTVTPRELRVGDELPPVRKMVTLEQMILFSSWPGEILGRTSRNQHTDDELARQWGRPAAIAQGLQTTGFVEELLLNAFGAQWLTTGKLSVKYTAMVLANDQITARGRVVGVRQDGGRTSLDLEVWCENQRGGQVLVGTASVAQK